MRTDQAASNVASPSFDAARANGPSTRSLAISVFANDVPKNRLAALVRTTIDRSLPVLRFLWGVFLERPARIAPLAVVRDFDSRA